MSGRTDLIAIIGISGISVIAVVTDLVRGRIYNWLTVPALVAGIGVSAYYGGWHGFYQSLLGIFAGLVFYGWLFWVRAIGGGDVKLLMAFGAWGGFRYAEEVAILGVLLGGALAITLLLAKGRFLPFLRKIYRLVFTLFARHLEIEVPEIDRKLTMPFGVPIAAAAVWAILAHPLEHWGIPLWP